MGKSSKSYETSASQEEFSEPHQTLIIYDWDDTLCPSCWIQESKLSFVRPPPREDRFVQPLRQLEHLVEALLETSLELGRVVIVTNAQEPWVETSCRHFLPRLQPLLARIRVTYAHSVYKALGLSIEGEESARVKAVNAEFGLQEESSASGMGAPGMYHASGGDESSASGVGAPGMYHAPTRDHGGRAIGGDSTWGTETHTSFTMESTVDLDSAPQRWKEAAFQTELQSFYSRDDRQSWKNVVSIGDSTFERDALRAVATGRPSKSRRCRTKTAKLRDDPTIEELIKQVKVLHDGISLIVQYDGNLDIEISEEDLDFSMEVIEKLMEYR